MMSAETKKAVRARLRRIAGQVEAIERMLDDDRPCVDVMHQLSAAQAAIGKVAEIVLRTHVETCVTDAVRSGSERESARMAEELLSLFGRYKRVREG